MNARPAVSVSSPARQCMRVDLPDPEGPMMAVKRPAGRARLTPSRARTAVAPLPYTFTASSARTAMGAEDAPNPAVVVVITSLAVMFVDGTDEPAEREWSAPASSRWG